MCASFQNTGIFVTGRVGGLFVVVDLVLLLLVVVLALLFLFVVVADVIILVFDAATLGVFFWQLGTLTLPLTFTLSFDSYFTLTFPSFSHLETFIFEKIVKNYLQFIN
jgi:hypothetical protein